MRLQSEYASETITNRCSFFDPNFAFQIMILEIEILKSKIHRATLTEANLNYVGSLTLDELLMEGANLIENEKVQVVNNNNGSRIETYVIKGERGSGVCCLNGAAARHGHPGDIVIIMSYARMDFEKAKQLKPKVIFPDAHNKIH